MDSIVLISLSMMGLGALFGYRLGTVLERKRFRDVVDRLEARLKEEERR